MADTRCVLGKIIGRGSYSSVHYELGKDYVIKAFTIDDEDSPTEINSATEVDIMFRIRSPYLTKGRCFYARNDCGKGKGSAIKMEKITGPISSLFKSPHRGPDMYLKILMHLALGLRCLHRNNYLHLDISYGNCMYSGTLDDPTGKLIDYGLSCATERDDHNMLLPITTLQLRVTNVNRPYENFTDEETYSDKTDIWSLATVYLHIITGDTLTNAREDRDIHRELTTYINPLSLKGMITLRVRAYVPAAQIDLLVDLLCKMLNYDVKLRYNIEQVVDHPFFESIKKQVKDTTGDGCEEVPVLPISPPITFGTKRNNALQDMVSKIKKHFPTHSSILMFSAIDLFMRAQAGVGGYVTQGEITAISTMCMLISFRLFAWFTELPKEYMESDSIHWKYEGMIIKMLKGVLNRPYIYAMARSKEELMMMYKAIIVDDDMELLNGYLRIDLAGFAEKIRTKISAEPISKYCTIKSLVSPVPADIYNIEAWNAGYTRLYFILSHETVSLCDIRVFTMAFDIYLKTIRLYPWRSMSKSQIAYVSCAAYVAAHERVYRNQPGAPKIPQCYSKEELPILWGIKDGIIDALQNEAYTNSFYEEATSLDMLYLLYTKYLADAGTSFNIYDSYHQLVPSKVFAEFARTYAIKPISKSTSIRGFFDNFHVPKKLDGQVRVLGTTA